MAILLRDCRPLTLCLMEDSPDPGRSNRPWTIRIICILFVLGSASIGLFPLARNSYKQYQIRDLIVEAHSHNRSSAGRLYRAPYSEPGTVDESGSGLGRAQLLLLGLADSDIRLQLQGAIYLA